MSKKKKEVEPEYTFRDYNRDYENMECEEQTKKENLVEACENYWKARRELYESKGSFNSKESYLKAKLKLYKGMSELFGPCDADGYPSDYSYHR